MKKIIDKASEYISSALLIATSILVFVQVILRYFFNYSIYWSEEVSLLMIVWFIFIGCSVAAKEDAHISMEILENMLPNKSKQVSKVIINIINVVFCGIMIYAGIGMVKSAIDLSSQATSISMPLWIAYISVPVGMALMSIQYVFKLLESIALLLRKEEKNEVKQ